MSKKTYVVIILSLVTLSLLSCSDPYGPGVSDRGSDRLRNMNPRAFIDTSAMHALLQNRPDMEDEALAQRAFEIADAMITEAQEPSDLAER